MTKKMTKEEMQKLSQEMLKMAPEEQIKAFSKLNLGNKSDYSQYLINLVLHSDECKKIKEVFNRRKQNEPIQFLPPEPSDLIVMVARFYDYTHNPVLHAPERFANIKISMGHFIAHELHSLTFLMHSDEKKLEAIKLLKFSDSSDKYLALNQYIKDGNNQYSLSDYFNDGPKTDRQFASFRGFLQDHVNYPHRYYLDSEAVAGLPQSKSHYKKNFSETEYIQFLGQHQDYFRKRPLYTVPIFKTFNEFKTICEIYKHPECNLLDEQLTTLFNGARAYSESDYPYTKKNNKDGVFQAILEEVAKNIMSSRANIKTFNDTLVKDLFINQKYNTLAFELNRLTNFKAIGDKTVQTVVQNNYGYVNELYCSDFHHPSSLKTLLHKGVDNDLFKYYVKNYDVLSSRFIDFVGEFDLTKIKVPQKEIVDKFKKNLQEHLRYKQSYTYNDLLNQLDLLFNVKAELKPQDLEGLFFVSREKEDRSVYHSQNFLKENYKENIHSLKDNPEFRQVLNNVCVNTIDHELMSIANLYYPEEFFKIHIRTIDKLVEGKNMKIDNHFILVSPHQEYMAEGINKMLHCSTINTHAQLSFLSTFIEAHKDKNVQFLDLIYFDRLIENYSKFRGDKFKKKLDIQMGDYVKGLKQNYYYSVEPLKSKLIKEEYQKMMMQCIVPLIKAGCRPKQSKNLALLANDGPLSKLIDIKTRCDLDSSSQKVVFEKMKKKKTRSIMKIL